MISPAPGRYVFDVIWAIVHPVAANAGHVLVVQPGTDEPILVVRRGTTDVIRTGPPNFGALIHHLLDGAIRERVPAARHALLQAG
jgi:hypothetical protein